MTLQRFVDNALARHVPGRVVWVALSGGLDSSLLLNVAAPLASARGIELRAIHVNHALQAAASDFESYCHKLCTALDVSLHVVHVSVNPKTLGLEAAAREARYQAFADTLAAGDRLWLAQHADDQAETFLLAALRGSGVRGLASMPARRRWRGIDIERPWLAVPRAALEREARHRGIDWCEDPTNAEVTFDRNCLRHRVLAPLQSRWPHVAAAFGRSASQLQEADELLGELAEIDLAEAGGDPACLEVSVLRSLSSARRRLLVRHALQRLGLPTPPAARLVELERQMALADADRLPRIDWPGGEARLWQQRLYLMAPLAVSDPSWQTTWSGVAPLQTPWGVHAISVRARPGGVYRPLRVSVRQGGESLHVAGRGTRDVKRLLQEAGIPPWQRERLPLVWCGDELVAILGVLSAEGWSQAS